VVLPFDITLLYREYKTLLQEALKSQAGEFDDYRESAVKEACRQLEKKMRNEFVHEREHAIADALGKARVCSFSLPVALFPMLSCLKIKLL